MFGRNIDDIYTINFNEMTGDKIWANVTMEKKLLSIFLNYYCLYLSTL